MQCSRSISTLNIRNQIAILCLCLTTAPNTLSEDAGGAEGKSRTCHSLLPSTSTSVLPSSSPGCAQASADYDSVSTVGYEYCQLFPDSGEGPFYISDPPLRPNVTEGRPGVAVTLTLVVRDVEGVGDNCSPLANVAVDLWHPDALGYYSGYRSFYKNGRLALPGGRHVDPTDSERFLRGRQFTDAAGRVTFHTIFPGWYAGRTNHYHLQVTTSDGVQYPGHIYFPEEMTADVAEEEPYMRNKNPKIPNEDDWPYANRGGTQTTIKMTGNVKSGLRGTMVLGIRI